ncbi:GAF domain-containing protein [Salicola sp. Rm-C-2C1-2]|uniref:GAF domain-containing protein n=1 Tax=Salicola sp. Rm-C-2C1-2 TaxID=3141321 RepID=UPI0032E4F00B
MKTPRTPCNEVARQQAVEETGLLASAPDSRLDRLTEIARFSLGVPIALVTLVDDNRQWFKSRQGLNVAETGRDISFCGHVVYQDVPMVIGDTLEDERFADNPLVTGPPHIRFYAGVPIHDDNGHPVGTLCLIDTEPRAFSESQQACLQALGDLAEQAIRQDQREARSLQESQRQKERELARTNRALTLLNEIAFELEGGLDEQIQQALALGRQFLGLDVGIVSDITGDCYTVRWCDVADGVALQPGQQFDLGSTYCDMVMSQQRELAIHEMRHSGANTHPCYETFQLEAYIGTRLESEDGTFGTVNFGSSAPREPFDDSERLFIRLLSRWISHQLIHYKRHDELEKLLRQIPGAIYQFRRWPDGTVVFPFVSSGIENLYGITPKQAMADAQALFARTHPDDLPAVAASIQHSFETLEPWHQAFRVGGDSQDHRWIQGTSIPEQLSDGSVLWHGFLGDITERKQLENMKDQFIATVSHELRTPLTSMLGSLKLVTAGNAGHIPDKASYLLAMAQRNGDRLANLINDLLDMEKLVSGKLRISTRVEFLAPIIEEAIEVNRELGTERNISIEYRPCVFEFRVDVDRDRLVQSLSNLLSNAIKFSPDNTSVEVTCTCDDSSIAIHVHDHGPGVPEEFRSKLFDRFAQAEASNRKKPGSGLGLAITKELIEQMNGSIHYEARDGGGSIFTIVLPEANKRH